MAKDVGQNVQSKSRSKNMEELSLAAAERRDLSETFLSCLFVWTLLLSFTVGSLFSSKDFSLAGGRERFMPYSFCSLSLFRIFLFTLYLSDEIHSAVSLLNYLWCPSTFCCMCNFLASANKCEFNETQIIKNIMLKCKTKAALDFLSY